MDYNKLIEYGGRISVGVLLIVILFAGTQGYWVFGSQYREMIEDRNTWKELALKGTRVAEQATRTTIGRPPNVKNPLPSNPTPADVSARLETLSRKTAYVTEPTDAPLP